MKEVAEEEGGGARQRETYEQKQGRVGIFWLWESGLRLAAVSL
jgi:hypothetical protein